MGAGNSAERIPNGPKLICPSPKVWDFDEKRLHWASVVRVVGHKVYNLVSKGRTENTINFPVSNNVSEPLTFDKIESWSVENSFRFVVNNILKSF